MSISAEIKSEITDNLECQLLEFKVDKLVNIPQLAAPLIEDAIQAVRKYHDGKRTFWSWLSTMYKLMGNNVSMSFSYKALRKTNNY